MSATFRLAPLLLFMSSSVVHAQAPASFYGCSPACREGTPALYDGANCDLLLNYEAGDGLTLWGPLQNAGPIRIGLNVRQPYDPIEPLPLRIRVLPYEGSATCAESAVGSLVWETLGVDPESCQTLLWSPRIELVDVGVALGSLYWVQLESEYRAGADPPAVSALRACLWVSAAPVSLETATWSMVKTLFDGR